MALLHRGDAISFEADDSLSSAGSDFLWAVTAIYLAVFLGLLILCFTTKESERVFHYLYTITLLVGSITYFAQAANLGSSTTTLDNGTTRQVSYARYITWLITFPASALGLGLVAGVSWTTIFSNIISAWIWALTYLAATYTASDYKWGFFAFGTLAYVILAASTLNESHEAAARMGVAGQYMIMSATINACWFLYPIAWGLSDGGHVIGVTAGFIFFGVLDLLSGPVWYVLFIVMVGRLPYGKLRLNFSEHRFLPPAGEAA